MPPLRAVLALSSCPLAEEVKVASPLLSTERGSPPPQGSPWWKTAGAGGSEGPEKLGQAWPGLLPMSQPRRGLFQTEGQTNKASLYMRHTEQPAGTRGLQGQWGVISI